jgi:hypothetical protein
MLSQVGRGACCERDSRPLSFAFDLATAAAPAARLVRKETP